jgi:hypothetical protein
MKLRSLLVRLAIILLIALPVGLGGFLWVSAQRLNQVLETGGRPYPSAAVLVPRQAPAVLSLLVNPDRLNPGQPLRLFNTLAGQQQSFEDFQAFKTSLLASVSSEYNADIQPWLGSEVTLAVTTLDIDRDGSNGAQPGYLLALAVRDSEQALEFLHSFWQRKALAGTDLVFDRYQGVQIISGRPALTGTSGNTLASALLGQYFLLFANDLRVLEDAINNIQVPELNLIHNPSYQDALATLDRPHLGLSFLNLSQLLEALYRGNASTSVADLAKLPPYLGLMLGVGPTPQGLLAETALAPAIGPAPEAPGSSTQLSGALRFVPANVSLLITSSNLNQLWEQTNSLLSNYKLSSWVTIPIAKVEKLWGLSLPETVFEWVKGDYAIAFLPNQQDNDWIFIADRSDPAADEAIASLDRFAEGQGFDINNVDLEGQILTAWTQLVAQGKQPFVSLQTQVQGVHTQVGQYEIFASSVPAISAALNASETATLANTEAFQEAIVALSDQGEGYFYLNWPNSRPLLEQRFPLLKLVELAGQPLFHNLQSVVLRNYGQESGVQHGGIAIQMIDLDAEPIAES